MSGAPSPRAFAPSSSLAGAPPFSPSPALAVAPSFSEKLSAKFRESPAVFGFLGLTVGALTLGLRSLSSGDKRQSQLMMRFRVLFQFCASAPQSARARLAAPRTSRTRALPLTPAGCVSALLGNVYLASPRRAPAAPAVDPADPRLEDLGALQALPSDAAALTTELR